MSQTKTDAVQYEKRIPKNYTIELYRFLFTFAVFVLHFRPYGKFTSENGHFNGAYLAVEYFLLSAVSFLHKPPKERPAAVIMPKEHLSDIWQTDTSEYCRNTFLLLLC